MTARPFKSMHVLALKHDITHLRATTRSDLTVLKGMEEELEARAWNNKGLDKENDPYG